MYFPVLDAVYSETKAVSSKRFLYAEAPNLLPANWFQDFDHLQICHRICTT